MKLSFFADADVENLFKKQKKGRGGTSSEWEVSNKSHHHQEYIKSYPSSQAWNTLPVLNKEHCMKVRTRILNCSSSLASKTTIISLLHILYNTTKPYPCFRISKSVCITQRPFTSTDSFLLESNMLDNNCDTVSSLFTHKKKKTYKKKHCLSYP